MSNLGLVTCICVVWLCLHDQSRAVEAASKEEIAKIAVSQEIQRQNQAWNSNLGGFSVTNTSAARLDEALREHANDTNAKPRIRTMMIANFRDDVLWSIARKAGLDPTVDQLENDAPAYVSFINAWVRKEWDAADWPEWTETHRFIPDSKHIVPYIDAVATDIVPPPGVAGPKVQLGRIWRVYLADPRIVKGGGLDTPHRLTPDGVWCGFEHGQTVWIKYNQPAPQFTSEEWDSQKAYQKGNLAYSPTTGQCYKSKTNANKGHDPSVVETGPPPAILNVATTQQRTPNDPGLIGQPGIIKIGFTGIVPGPDPPNPPGLNSIFYIMVTDVNQATLGDATHIANGVETMAAIISDLATQLDTALPGSFTITADTIAQTITISSSSIFHIAQAFFTPFSPPSHTSYMKVVQIQTYFPVVSPAPGTPQKTILTLSADQAVPGATYTVIFTGSDGEEHIVTHTASETDTASQILAGISQAVTDAMSADDYFENVLMTLNPTLLTLTFEINDVASVNAELAVETSPYWERVQFPMKLVDPVVRGALADSQREEGQTDKADGEEQKVPTETTVNTAKFIAPRHNPLTDQAKPRTRYSATN